MYFHLWLWKKLFTRTQALQWGAEPCICLLWLCFLWKCFLHWCLTDVTHWRLGVHVPGLLILSTDMSIYYTAIWNYRIYIWTYPPEEWFWKSQFNKCRGFIGQSSPISGLKWWSAPHEAMTVLNKSSYSWWHSLHFFFYLLMQKYFYLFMFWISEIKVLVLLTEVSLRGRICYGSNPKRSDKWRAAGNPTVPTERDGITGVFLSHPTSRALWGAPLGLQAAAVPRREGRAELRPPGGSSSPRAAATWVPARHGRAEGSLGGAGGGWSWRLLGPASWWIVWLACLTRGSAPDSPKAAPVSRYRSLCWFCVDK